MTRLLGQGDSLLRAHRGPVRVRHLRARQRDHHHRRPRRLADRLGAVRRDDRSSSSAARTSRRTSVERSIDCSSAGRVHAHRRCTATSSSRTRARRSGPRPAGQKRYVDAIRKNTVTFGIGPAGTGKTYLAMAMAVEALKHKEVGRIILTRPAVEAGESLGFLPGTLTEKVDPYLRPLYDALFDMMDAEKSAHADRARRHRDRAARLHARPHAQRLASSSSTRRRTRAPSR